MVESPVALEQRAVAGEETFEEKSGGQRAMETRVADDVEGLVLL